jgi:hypothetical protein
VGRLWLVLAFLQSVLVFFGFFGLTQVVFDLVTLPLMRATVGTPVELSDVWAPLGISAALVVAMTIVFLGITKRNSGVRKVGRATYAIAGIVPLGYFLWGLWPLLALGAVGFLVLWAKSFAGD